MNAFATTHSRDYYRGKSFHYAGEWVEGAHYVSDDYNVDFVSINNVLVACAKSHLSTIDNCPDDYLYSSTGYINGIISSYWDFVMAGKIGENGRVYVPRYDQTTGILSWELIEDIDASSTVEFDLSLTRLINEAVERSNNATNELINLKQEINNSITDVNNATQEAINQAANAAQKAEIITSLMNHWQAVISNLITSGTGDSTEAVMSQKATTDALNTKINKVLNATEGAIPILNTSGSIIDSTVVLSDIVKRNDITIASQSDINTILNILN